MASDPLILTMDSSAAHCAAALVHGATVLAEAYEPMQKGQTEAMMPMLNQVMTGQNWDDLDGFAVCTGPGNFTGIRIGVALARGLALGHGCPAIGVSVMEAMAFNTSGHVLVTIDARRDAVYAQLFHDGIALSEPYLTGPNELVKADLPRPLICLGYMAGDLAPMLGATKAVIADRAPMAALAQIAAQRLTADAPRPAPLYIRSADAALPSEPPPVILP